jgi:hypothetical protein
MQQMWLSRVKYKIILKKELEIKRCEVNPAQHSLCREGEKIKIIFPQSKNEKILDTQK